MAATFDAIATATLTTASNTITFSNIPSTYTELYITLSGSTSSFVSTSIRFNNATSPTYGACRQYASGAANMAFNNYNASAESLTGIFDTGQSFIDIWIPGYKDTTLKKGFLSRCYIRGSLVGTWWGGWTGTSAISRIDLLAGVNYQVGTVATVYGTLA